MPELPEVECVRRMLEPVLVGARVRSVELRRRDTVVLPGDPPGGWGRSAPRQPVPDDATEVPAGALLGGSRVAELRRHGKALAIVCDRGSSVVVHLGMTGWVGPVGPVNEPPHTHCVWTLAGGRRVAFADARRFGGLWCLPTLTDLERRWSALGPDALTARASALQAGAESRRTSIKAALLDQRVIAGVGNIYADEALFRAGIRPEALCTTISGEGWRRLAAAVRHELRRGIQRGGASVRTYRRPDGSSGDAQRRLSVYGRAGETCRRCREPLTSGLVAQRTTVWCPRCQP